MHQAHFQQPAPPPPSRADAIADALVGVSMLLLLALVWGLLFARSLGWVLAIVPAVGR